MISIIISLIVIGVLLWLMETYIPMDPTIKRIIQAVVIIIAVIWVLQSLGLIGSLNSLSIK